MTDTAVQSEISKLRAFEQRMQTQGAAGFADGLEPWDDLHEAFSEGGKPIQTSNRRSERQIPEKSTCERLFPSIAMLAVAALLVGIGGVWFSTDTTPRVAKNSIQPLPIATPGSQAPDLSAPAPVLRDTPVFMEDPPVPVAALEIAPLTTLETAPVTDRATTDSLTPFTAPTAEVQPMDIVPDTDTTTPLAALPATETQTEQAASNDLQIIAGNLPPPAAGNPDMIAISTSPEPATASPQATARNTAADGKWVVNISAYTFESMAKRKLEEFRQKGVSAEIIPVTVNDKPMHRIRVTGYDSNREAKTWVSLLQDRLGVESAWVSKR